jgi:type VI protein secretion system component VasF
VTKGRYSGLPAVPPIAAAISTAATAAAAAAAATTAATAAATTTAAAAAGTTTAAAAAAATLRTLFSFVHAQRASVNHLAVDAFNRALSLFIRAHRHECKAAGLPSGAISHDVDIRHFAVLRERSPDGLGIRVK